MSKSLVHIIWFMQSDKDKQICLLQKLIVNKCCNAIHKYHQVTTVPIGRMKEEP